MSALKQQSDAELSAARRKARQRAAQERLERIRQAEQELKQQQAARPSAEQPKVKASVTDPQARVMRQGDGGFAPSYNVQISTDAHHGVIVASDVSQAQEDSQELQPALERIEDNTGRLPDQTLVDGGYTTRQNILQTAEQSTELIGSLGEVSGKLVQLGIVAQRTQMPVAQIKEIQETYERAGQSAEDATRDIEGFTAAQVDLTRVWSQTRQQALAGLIRPEDRAAMENLMIKIPRESAQQGLQDLQLLRGELRGIAHRGLGRLGG